MTTSTMRPPKQTADTVVDLRRALDFSPDSLDTRHNLAVALAKQGQLEEAIVHFRQVAETKPDWADVWGNLGLALVQAGKPEEAVEAYRQLVKLRPEAVEAANNLGTVLRNLGRLDEAVEVLRRAAEIKPDAVETWHNLGLTYSQQGKRQDAIAAYNEALKHKPQFAEALNNVGIAYKDESKLEDAARCFREALALRPEASETLGNLGVVLAAQGRHQEALGYYYEALRLRPEAAETHSNLGNALRAEGLPEEAIIHFKRALEIKPDYAEAFNNMAIAHGQRGDFKQGFAGYEKAIKLKPDYADAHMNRALGWLAVGDLSRGWPEYEWRWQVGNLKLRHEERPRWDGSPLDGRTILLYPEQGLGDTLQFIRYAELIKRGAGRLKGTAEISDCRLQIADLKQRNGDGSVVRSQWSVAAAATDYGLLTTDHNRQDRSPAATKVVFECPKSLMKIVARCDGIDCLVEEGQPLPEFDVQAPLLSLPGLVRTTLGNIPADVPYLFADPELVEAWGKELARFKEVKVGIAWQGSLKYKGDKFRSIPLRAFAPLAKVRGARLFSLQKGYGEEQIAHAGVGVTKPGRAIDDKAGPFMDTAAILRNLDLLITSDTAIAHLAGGLGVPVWLLLPFAPDWRWMRSREDSPWYPTMRLFRQRFRSDWEEVFSRVAGELATFAAEPGGRGSLPSRQETEDWHRQGLELLKQGNLERAGHCFRKVVALSPNHVDGRHNLGVALARQKRRGEAIDCFRKVLQLKPHFADAYGNLGLAYLHEGAPHQAIAQLQRALELRPLCADTHNNLGAAWSRLGNNDEAVRCYEKAISVQPDHAGARANLERQRVGVGD
jgi:tetratricopeptide (TPR) repeat protein